VSQLEMIAHLKIRPGQLEGFKDQAAELLRLTRERDTQTLRYDWFIHEDTMECEVHELYQSEQGLIEHNMHVMEARAVLFRDYAYDHRMSSYGEISPELRALGQKHAGGISEFSLFQSLELSPTV
jgi:quinol monooxygenase YgiN